MLQSSFFNAKFNWCYHTNRIVKKVNSDILIFGSSKASHHYVPSILSDSLKCSVYNCGMYGKCIYYHYGLLMLIKERYLPKAILLDVTNSDIYDDRLFTIDGVKDLAPYYGVSKDLDTLINKISPFEKFKMLSMLYRYNSRIIDICRDNFRKTDQNWENGYMPLSGYIQSEKNTMTIQEENNIEQDRVLYIEKFILFCKQNNVKIFICISPVNFMCENNNTYITVANIAAKHDVPFLNHYCDTYFSENNIFFKDVTHLNREGAVIYSSLIGEEIRNMFECQ